MRNRYVALRLSPYGKLVEKSTHTQMTAFVVMKSWYSPKYGPYSVQHTKVMRAYTYKPDADADVEKLNQECNLSKKNCTEDKILGRR